MRVELEQAIKAFKQNETLKAVMNDDPQALETVLEYLKVWSKYTSKQDARIEAKRLCIHALGFGKATQVTQFEEAQLNFIESFSDD